MNNKELIEEIKKNIPYFDRSYHFLRSVERTFHNKGYLSNKQYEALKSIHQRVMIGKDGGYTPTSNILSKQEHHDLLFCLFCLPFQKKNKKAEDIRNWFYSRGFITNDQYKYLLHLLSKED